MASNNGWYYPDCSDCNEDGTFCKDDCYKSGMITYFVLFFVALFLFICGLVNIYNVLYRHRRYKNLPLFLFYIFALLTLLCNCTP